MVVMIFFLAVQNTPQEEQKGAFRALAKTISLGTSSFPRADNWLTPQRLSFRLTDVYPNS